MKTIIIQKSRKTTAKYLTGAIILLSFFVYRFLTDTTEYPKGNSFYWIAIILLGLTTVYFLYEYIDKTPLYTVTTEGIFKKTEKTYIAWTDLYAFECKSPYRKYVSPKYAIFYDKAGNEVFTIDFTHSDISLEKMEGILKTKLKSK